MKKGCPTGIPFLFFCPFDIPVLFSVSWHSSLYAVQDVREVYVKDNEWFTEYIRVEGKRVIVKINDRTVVDYTEPEGIEKERGRALKRISSGTFALQGHDPDSKVYFKDVMVRVLP